MSLLALHVPVTQDGFLYYLILTHPQLTLHLVVNTFLYNVRLDPYIQKFVSNTLFLLYFHCILTISVQPKHHDLHHPIG